MTTSNIFNVKKFKGNGTFANVLRKNDEKIGVCYSRTIDAAVTFFISRYNLRGAYTIQSHAVYGHVNLGDATYRDLNF